MSSAVTPNSVKSERDTPWQSLLAWCLSLLTHAGLLIALLVILARSRVETSRSPKSSVQFVLARTKPVSPPAQAMMSSSVETNLDEIIARDASIEEVDLDEGLARGLPALPAVTAFDSLTLDGLSPPSPFSAKPSASGIVKGNNAPRATTTRSAIPSGVPSGIDVEKIVREDRLRTAARRPVGEPTQVSLYGGAAAEGRSFVFLIDRSKSTSSEGSGALVGAEQELLAALRNLQPMHRFQVIAYDEHCKYLHRRELLLATDENKNAVREFVQGLVAAGATEHELALNSALQHEPDVVYLLTDGGDPYLSEVQIQRITKRAAGRSSIHCVGFGHGPAPESQEFLRRLAQLNRGGYTYVDLAHKK